ncbi:unnamed protein product, partial [Amoebophrya sp. A25]
EVLGTAVAIEDADGIEVGFLWEESEIWSRPKPASRSEIALSQVLGSRTTLHDPEEWFLPQHSHGQSAVPVDDVTNRE